MSKRLGVTCARLSILSLLAALIGCGPAHMNCRLWQDKLTGPQGQVQTVCTEWVCDGGYEKWKGKCITHEEAMKRKWGSS